MNIYERAVKQWGYNLQIDMIIEECAELIDAIQKYRRKRVPINNVIDELCDVQLMINEAKYIFGIDEEYWDSNMRSKIFRLEQRLEKYK